MLPVTEASARILAHVPVLPAEHVPLAAAPGRVLAAPVVSPLALPPWDNAGMDGYATRAADVHGASTTRPVRLRVIETVAAGGFPSRALGAGEAVRIMTGAPVPEHADTVIRVEDTQAGRDVVEIRSDRDAGRNVRPRGQDVRSGEAVMGAGTTLGPAQLALLAAVGASTVPVHRRPRVALLATGDELVDLDRFQEVLEGRRIVSSNSYALAALVRETGGVAVELGIAPDAPEVLHARLAEARTCDLVITTGGVSVGAFDYTREVLERLGAEMKLWRVRMRPGAPLGFGMLGGVPWLGLPGNPVSAMVTFELFAAPAIRRMLGMTRLFRRAIRVRVVERITLAAPLTHFLRVTLTDGDDGVSRARLTGPQGSGLLTSMARADALLVVPGDRERVEPGEELTALPLGERCGMRETLEL